ncbi:MAG TPA: hypothetical protein VGM44_01580 [Polyangiaceae bacterium]|jgi:hypothetical protein
MITRSTLQLALGSPAEPHAKSALEIIVEALHAEANAFAETDTTDPRGLALACRLEALKAFVDEYLTVEWKDQSEVANG